MSIFFAKRPDGNATDPEQNGSSAPKPAEPISIPLYIAGGVVQISALMAVAYQLAEPAFAYFTIILTVLGLVVSYNLRRIGTSPRLIFIGTLLLGLIFLYALRGTGVFGAIIPLEVQGSQEVLLVSALAFTATFSAFLLLTDEAVVFSCVWAIAIIGLTGTVNINRELIISFVIFLGAATFLLIHQNALAQATANRSPLASRFHRYRGLGNRTAETPRDGARLLRTQLGIAAVAWIASIMLGFLIAIPVQMVGRNLSLATIIQRLKVPPSVAGRTPALPRLVFDDLNRFNVGLGPIEDDPTERMTVLSEEPHYWRGRAYNNYMGRGWQSTLLDQGQEIAPTPGPETAEGFSTFELPEKREPLADAVSVIRQTHRFQVNGGIYGPLFAAAEPRVVRALFARLTQRPDNTIGTGRNGGAEYEVESEIVQFTANQLRKTGYNYPDEVKRLYLGQSRTNDVLRSIVRTAIAGAPDNPYDRAQAIRLYISRECIYTRDARAVPRDRDAAEFFLNESKEGYCDLYATAMAVLCRYAGIPTRVATGFAPGTQDQNYTPPPGDKRQRYILRGSDQHAWTEVYFNGYGWVPFDATQDTLALITPTQTPEPERQETPWEKWLRTRWVALLLVGLGLLGVLFVLWNETVGRGGRTRIYTGQTRPYAAQIARIYQTTLRQVERRASRRELTETPMEYARRLEQSYDPEVGKALGHLTEVAYPAFYGSADVSEATIEAAHRARNGVEEAFRTRPERVRAQRKAKAAAGEEKNASA